MSEHTGADQQVSEIESAARPRLPDRMLVTGLVLAVVLFLATLTVAYVVHRNPSVPPLSLPTASSR